MRVFKCPRGNVACSFCLCATRSLSPTASVAPGLWILAKVRFGRGEGQERCRRQGKASGNTWDLSVGGEHGFLWNVNSSCCIEKILIVLQIK